MTGGPIWRPSRTPSGSDTAPFERRSPSAWQNGSCFEKLTSSKYLGEKQKLDRILIVLIILIPTRTFFLMSVCDMNWSHSWALKFAWNWTTLHQFKCYIDDYWPTSITSHHLFLMAFTLWIFFYVRLRCELITLFSRIRMNFFLGYKLGLYNHNWSSLACMRAVWCSWLLEKA